MAKRKLTASMNALFLYNNLKKAISQIEDGRSDDFKKFYKDVKHQVAMYEERKKRIGEDLE